MIRRVVEGGAYSNLTVAAAVDRAGLEGRDRSLAVELAYGTLRRLVPIDHALADLADRPLERITPGALACLRLGAYQLLHTRVPPHAAVSETVGLAPARARGFVNAVLRRLAAEPPDPPSGQSDEDVAIRTGTLPWIVAELRAVLGDDAETEAAALGARAPLSVRINTCRTEPQAVAAAFAAAGFDPLAGALRSESLRVEAASPRELPGWAEGRFAVQDEASTFVVAAALAPEPGERVLDACAGPGGKAVHVGCLVGPGGLVVAADAAPGRARLVAVAADRLGVDVRVVAMDARRPAVDGGFDRVLVDAPCTGIGSARRRPELLWRPGPDDPARLAELQVDIATACADLVRPGGRLVYSVCTFPRVETDGVCDEVLRRRADLEPAPTVGPDGPAERIRLWPSRHGTDAMFVAAFRRRVGGHG